MPGTRQEDSLLPKKKTSASPTRRRIPFFGKFRGTVVNNVDPLIQGRLQAMVPDVLGSQVSGWALPSAPYVGQQAGLYAIPPVGSQRMGGIRGRRSFATGLDWWMVGARSGACGAW